MAKSKAKQLAEVNAKIEEQADALKTAEIAWENAKDHSVWLDARDRVYKATNTLADLEQRKIDLTG